MVRIPPPDEYRRRWSQLETRDRRRILRAVNRGQALDDPREAALAVPTARGQQRFWRWAWLLGPVSSLVLFFQDITWQRWLANAVLITVMMGLMSLFWLRRARRAEDLNTEVAQRRGKRRQRKSPGPSKPSGSSHTPRRGRSRR